MLDGDGRARDLSGVIADIDPALLSSGFAALKDVDPQKLPLVAEGTRIGPPISFIGKFICIGLNYKDHAAESNMAIPEEPIIFMKATSAVCGPDDDVVLPPDAQKGDWEVELGVVIGRECRYVSEADAMRHVAGVVDIEGDSGRRARVTLAIQVDHGVCHAHHLAVGGRVLPSRHRRLGA